MRPIEEDPGYREMQRQESALSHKLTSVSQALLLVSSSELKPDETVAQRLGRVAELLGQRDELERQHLLVAQALWNLRASWS